MLHFIRTKLVITFLMFALNLNSSCKHKLNTSTNKKEISILFIGNSLTYTNNLPKLVKERFLSEGIEAYTKMVAFPNYAIEDHWNDGKIQKLISSTSYDYVIIQQGPSSQADGRTMLIDYGKKFAKLCQKNNTQLCFFMVWPSIQYFRTFEGVIKNYSDAAQINNAILLPVGKTWKAYIDQSNDYSYYGPDGFHPSLKGSQEAATVITNHLLESSKSL